jgi:hypothetical protein
LEDEELGNIFFLFFPTMRKLFDGKMKKVVG